MLKEYSGTSPIGVLLCGLLFLLLAVSSVKAQYFTIDRYHADIEIHENSDISVTETIEVEFSRERHGIYRDIPYKYKDEFGSVLTTPLDVISVTDYQGGGHPYKVTRQGGFVNIRIGDPDRYVDGRQVYTISYRVSNILMFFEDHDELYWNVTGNEWKAPIRHAEATIKILGGKTSSSLMASCYTGRMGSREKNCDWQANTNQATFVCLRELSSGEGFTVALDWDKGIVTPPTAWQKFLWKLNIRDNWIVILPLFMLLFMFYRWYNVGRDPKVRDAVVVRYQPPEFDTKPLNAAEVGMLVDEKLDQRDITATVIGLAEKGFLKIESITNEGLIALFNKTDYKLIKIENDKKDLSAFERQLLHDLFKYEGNEIQISELKNKFYRSLPSLKKLVSRSLVDKRYFKTGPDEVRGKYILLTIVITAVFGVLYYLTGFWSPVLAVVCFVISFFIGVLFSNIMPAKTRAGAMAHMEILGFQEFMNRADKDKIERMGKQDFFYKYLPYAIALDVVDHWSQAFKDIFMEPPRWFVGPYAISHFNANAFSHSINNITTSLGSAMYSAPRGSGAKGGGGSSGGGGGGGGGGSW
ncbi:MAG: DUF2207 domain-containing protein [Candidatus Zixiibacteriota bacterium]